MNAHQTTRIPCSHCDGKGYIELRDCSGEVQREETCSFCGGTGQTEHGAIANFFKNFHIMAYSSCSLLS